MSMDDCGRLFYTSNSNPGLADFQPFEYSNRNSGHLSKNGINVNVASDKRVFANRVNPGVNHGISGPIDVKGVAWNSVMPGHGPMPQFQGKGLPQVLSYIRTASGNKTDIVSDKEIRKTLDTNKDHSMPWTVEELNALGL